VDLRNQFHIDHVFPISRFTPTRLRRAGVPEELIDEYRENANHLANLQLLEGAFNNEKRASLPAEWLSKKFKDPEERQAYCSRHDLKAVPDEIIGFGPFIKVRRERLKEKITELLHSEIA
jgi:hypothetical protein